MMKAIKVLEKRIEALNKELDKAENKEPEMLSDYELLLNQKGNIELEIIEIGYAIKILSEKL